MAKAKKQKKAGAESQVPEPVKQLLERQLGSSGAKEFVEAILPLAGETPAVQTTTEGAAEANAAGGRSAEESPGQATPPPASSTPETPVGADASSSAGRSNKDEERGAGSEERKEAGPPASFNAGAADWQRYRIHGERGPVVEIARASGPVYIKSAHGVMLCDEGCLIGRYPERPEELFVVSETDFNAVAYMGKPGVSIVDERNGA